jgi:hypothetical protein
MNSMAVKKMKKDKKQSMDFILPRNEPALLPNGSLSSTHGKRFHAGREFQKVYRQ